MMQNLAQRASALSWARKPVESKVLPKRWKTLATQIFFSSYFCLWSTLCSSVSPVVIALELLSTGSQIQPSERPEQMSSY